MAQVTKLGWCYCCRRPDQPACGGRPQSKSYWNGRIHCRSASLSCGSQSCRPIGRDRAGWFNPEFQMHGLSSTGTMTISWQENCIISFLRSPAAASAKVFFGTWLCSTGSKPNGAVLRLSSQTVRLWMQCPPSQSVSHRSDTQARPSFTARTSTRSELMKASSGSVCNDQILKKSF
jgi:hypothetical protein